MEMQSKTESAKPRRGGEGVGPKVLGQPWTEEGCLFP